MDLDYLLKSGLPPGRTIRTVDTPEEISSGQFRYLMGLSRDYLPDGHSRSYSEYDIQLDLLRDFYRDDVRGVRRGLSQFHELWKREAGVLIEWVLAELGRETQVQIPPERPQMCDFLEQPGVTITPDDIDF